MGYIHKMKYYVTVIMNQLNGRISAWVELRSICWTKEVTER